MLKRAAPAHQAGAAVGRRLSPRAAAAATATDTGRRASLPLGRPGDRFEREANAQAERLMRMHAAPSAPRCACGGGCPVCRDGARPAAAVVQRRTSLLGEAGQALEPDVRASMEAGLGYDLGAVRIHTRGRVPDATAAIGACAFTVDNHVAFARNHYAPHSAAGRRLLAHELTHAVQQTGRTASDKQAHRVQRTPGTMLQGEFAEAGSWSGNWQWREAPRWAGGREEDRRLEFEFPLMMGEQADWQEQLKNLDDPAFSFTRSSIPRYLFGLLLAATEPNVAQDAAAFHAIMSSYWGRRPPAREAIQGPPITPVVLHDYSNTVARKPEAWEVMRFVRPLYYLGAQLDLPNAFIGEENGWARDFVQERLARLLAMHQAELIREVSADPQQRVMRSEGLAGLAEQGGAAVRETMMVQAVATATAAATALVESDFGDSSPSTLRQMVANGGAIIRQVQAVHSAELELRNSVAEDLIAIAFAALPAQGAIAGATREAGKRVLSRLFVVMGAEDSLDAQISRLTLEFEREIRNLGDSEDHDETRAARASDAITEFRSAFQ